MNKGNLDFIVSDIPKYISMLEMTGILSGKKQGMTQKEIKQTIDQNRKMQGTYTGQGISTNSISRLLSPKTGKTYKARIESAWVKHEARKEYKKRITPYLDRIIKEHGQDSKEVKDYLRDREALHRIQKREARVKKYQYIAEDDRIVFDSP